MSNIHHPQFGKNTKIPGKEAIKYLPHFPGDGGHDPAREIGTSNWVFSYADMMTSMVVFLIILLSFSRIDYDRLASVSEQMKDQTTKTDKTQPDTAQTTATKTPATPLNQVESKLNSLSHIEGVDFQKVGSGAYLTIKDSVLFESGRAKISDEALKRLTPVFTTLKDLPKDYDFVVEGYSDDNPIHTFEYASNWELSAARALSVMLFMRDLGFEPTRLSFQAFGEFQPLVPNRDAQGKPIPENQSRNRRAVIKIHQNSGPDDMPALKSSPDTSTLAPIPSSITQPNTVPVQPATTGE